MKTHFAAYKENDRPDFPLDVTCLCGEEVKDAKPVLELELDSGILMAKSTLYTCQVCLALALTPVDKKHWVYGLLPAKDADRINAEAI